MRLLGDLRGVHRLVLLAAGNSRVVLGIQTDGHFEKFLVRTECLSRDGKEFRVGLDNLQIALRDVLVELNPIRSHRFVLGKDRLRLAR